MSAYKVKMKVLSFFINVFRNRNRVSPDRINFLKVKTVVIVNNKRLGDFLFCTPAIKALKDASPNVRLIAVTSLRNKELIMGCPYIDDVKYMNESIVDSIRVGRELRKENPELGIIFHSKSPYDIVAMTFAGVSCLMKHYFGNERKVLIDSCDAVVIGGVYPPVQNNLSLVGQLGVNTDNKTMFYPSPVEGKSSVGVNIGIQLGASGADRYFPVEMAAQVVEAISREFPECKFHLIGAKNESSLSDGLYGALNSELSAKIVDHIGKTSLRELASLINNFTVLITPDTGCLHIATALQTKTVSLFVIKQQKASVPQQDPDLHQVLYASDYASDTVVNKVSKLSSIPVGDIVAATTRALR